MGSDSFSSSFQRVVLITACLALTVAALYFAQKFLIPLFLAVLLSFVLAPLVMYVQRTGLRRTPAVLVVVVLTFIVLTGITWIVTLQLEALAKEIPNHKATIVQKISSLQGSEGSVFTSFVNFVKEISAEVQGGNPTESPSNQGAETIPVVVKAEPTVFSGPLAGMAAPVLEILASAGLVVVLVIFILIMREDLRDRILFLIGHGRLTSATKALNDAAQRISRFLLMQTVINVIFAVLFGVGLYFIGVPYAFLWGILAGLLRFVPYLGIWVALLIPFTLTVAIFPGWFEPVMVLVLCGVLEILAANVMEPLLLGHSTGISPIALLVSAAFWTWLWGPIGLVLSTPMTSCLVVLGKYVPQLSFVYVLLGDQQVLEASASFYQRLLARDQDEAEDIADDYLRTHSPQALYDEVLIPALIYAKSDHDRGELSDLDVQFISQETHDLIEDHVTVDMPPHPNGQPRDEDLAKSQPLLLGCPARHGFDEEALIMFTQLLEGGGCPVEVLSTDVLTSEIVNRVRKDAPALICIASLPPGGIAQTRYLCKRLRAQSKEMKIMVGRWGQNDNIVKIRQRLLEAGADHVATSLRESEAYVQSLLPVLQAKTRAADQLIPVTQAH